MTTKLAALLSACALIAPGLAACGDDETSTPTSTNQGGAPIENTTGGEVPSSVTISADADGALAFDPSEASVAAGQPTVVFDNPSSIPHDLVVEDANGNELARTDVINGDSQDVSFDAESDTYTFYCSVDSHREAGMEGTLSVVNP